MNRDDIIKLALEAGIKNDCDGIWCEADQLIAFAHLVAATENRACAQIADASEPYKAMDLIMSRWKA